MTLNELGKKVSVKEIAEFFDLKESTVKNNYRKYGGVKIGRRVLFFENLIVDKVRKEHALQSKRQEENPVESAGKETGRGTRSSLSYKGESLNVGRQGSGGGNHPQSRTGRADDPLGLAP